MTTSKGRERKITIVSLASIKQIPVAGSRDIDLDSCLNDEGSSSIVDFDEDEETMSTLDETLTQIDLEKESIFLKKCIKKQVKELLWLFFTFCVYIVFGMFLFFYIEECSGAPKPSDDSYVHKDRTTNARYKNATASCIDLTHVFELNTNSSTDEIENNQTTINFLSFCGLDLMNASLPVVTKNATKASCYIDEWALLKYAEFTIFTCLTIGIHFIFLLSRINSYIV